MRLQQTVRDTVVVEGVGLHSGLPVRLTLRPAGPGTGRVFLRTDLPRPLPIRACVDHVVATSYATTLGREDQQVSTVEHLLAALGACGVDNVFVEVTAPEVPAMDGSAAPWLALLASAGVVPQGIGCPVLVVREPVTVVQGDRIGRILPAARFEVAVTVDFPHPLLRDRHLEVALHDGAFARDLAWARTFGFLADVERMRRAGLAKGGGLDCALVFDDAGVVNDGGQRGPDEAIRHKALDLVGDLELLGVPVLGRFEAIKPGHSLHLAMLQALLGRVEAWGMVNGDGDEDGGRGASSSGSPARGWGDTQSPVRA